MRCCKSLNVFPISRPAYSLHRCVLGNISIIFVLKYPYNIILIHFEDLVVFLLKKRLLIFCSLRGLDLMVDDVFSEVVWKTIDVGRIGFTLDEWENVFSISIGDTHSVITNKFLRKLFFYIGNVT